jgi:hypothetical protein
VSVVHLISLVEAVGVERLGEGPLRRRSAAAQAAMDRLEQDDPARQRLSTMRVQPLRVLARFGDEIHRPFQRGCV